MYLVLKSRDTKKMVEFSLPGSSWKLLIKMFTIATFGQLKKKLERKDRLPKIEKLKLSRLLSRYHYMEVIWLLINIQDCCKFLHEGRMIWN